ncbi:MAG: LysE family transporter [Anaerolineae bacterium]|jgi:threonine/homoserine/homoserine lactone efflux protein
MLTYLALGFSMGISAGLSPGPLLTLVITASLRSGLAGGLRVALAPFVTDAPIIGLAVLLAGRLPPDVLHWVGTVGGLVVIWMGVDTLRAARGAHLPQASTAQADARRELWRGVVVNALNPHPYLFWATVGGPALVRGWRASPAYVAAFLVPFYALLVGSKMVIAWMVSGRAGALSLDWYRRILGGCGVLLLGMGGLLIWQMWTGT